MEHKKGATVYVVQESSRHDFVDAERFGDIKFMSDTDYRTDRASKLNTRIMLGINDSMKEFEPDEDFLLLCGDPVLIGICFYLGYVKKERIRLLKWNSQAHKYIEVPIKDIMNYYATTQA